MKRILVSLFAICLVLSMSVFSVSAADSYELIPLGATWSKTDNGGASVTVTENADSVEFGGSTSGTWPCVDTYYDSEDIVKANIDEYSLVYDFTVAGGAININFYFTDGFGNSSSFTIANNTLGSVNYDSGSGDLYDGDYKGVIKLSDFVNSTAFLNAATFNKDFITEDNEIIFTGIQVYSVNGGVVTVKALDIVANDETSAPTDDESEAASEAVSEAESEAVSEVESEAVSEEESKAVSESVSKEESKTESSATVAESSEAETESEGLGTGAIIAIIVAAVAVIAVIVVFIVKKKK